LRSVTSPRGNYRCGSRFGLHSQRANFGLNSRGAAQSRAGALLALEAADDARRCFRRLLTSVEGI
jgi:hypothetical protein